jgi:hypothetical protein
MWGIAAHSTIAWEMDYAEIEEIVFLPILIAAV